MGIRYALATKATHLLGDISREEPDYCIIASEDKDDYIGHWITGFGFVGVKFPKSSTRILEGEELEAAKTFSASCRFI